MNSNEPVEFVEWFESSEHTKRSAAERAAQRLHSQSKVETRVVERFGKFFVEYKDRLLNIGEYA